jgi:hypothetical protein
MVDRVLIGNSIDKAIIMSFDKADSGILPRKAIIKLVKQETNEKEPNIAKRIEKMSKNKYLIWVDRGLYRLSTEVEFELAGESLPSEEGSGEIPAEMRRKHASDLKEAIEVWKGVSLNRHVSMIWARSLKTSRPPRITPYSPTCVIIFLIFAQNGRTTRMS